MDLKKRILSLVLALALVLSCVSAFADEEVPISEITLTASETSIDWISGGDQDFRVAATYNAGATQHVVFSSSDEKVAKFPNDQPIAGHDSIWFDVMGPGKVTITAEAVKADGTKTGVKKTVDVEVKEIKTTKLELKHNYALVAYVDSWTYLWNQMRPVFTPDNSSYRYAGYTYKSSDTTIASVDASGFVWGVKAGTVNITVTTADGVSATVPVEIKAKEEEAAVESIAFTADEYTFNYTYGGIAIGDYVTVKPDTYSAEDLTWSVDDTSVATVSASGYLSFKKAGKVKVTAALGGKSATCTVIIKEMESFTMAFAQKEVTMKLWSSFTPTLVFDPVDANVGLVSFKSSNSDVVSVEYDDEDGEIYLWATGTGKATITATAIRNDVIMATATCEITVEGTPIKSISFPENEYKAGYGDYGIDLYDKLVFDPINFRVDAEALVWTSSDIATATVSASGYVSFVKPGTAKITVKLASDESISASTYVTIDAIALEKVKFADKQYIMGFSASENEDNHTYLSVKPIYTPTNAFIKNVRFESTNANVATATYVLASGNSYIEVQANGLGKAVITAYFDDGVETKEASFTVVVTDKITKVKLNKTKKTLYMKPKALRTYQLVAKDATTRAKFGADMIKWKSSNKKVATVDENGLVTAKGVGTCTITATVKDKLKKSATCKITVLKKKKLK